MPALDACQPQVIRALEKAGWEIIATTVPIHLEHKRMVYADLSIRRASQQIIVVEVKCFSSNRPLLDEFYHAVGQYLFYRNVLTLRDIRTPIYLTVPLQIYNTLFQRFGVQSTVNDAKIKLIIIDLQTEEVKSWID